MAVFGNNTSINGYLQSIDLAHHKLCMHFMASSSGSDGRIYYLWFYSMQTKFILKYSASIVINSVTIKPVSDRRKCYIHNFFPILEGIIGSHWGIIGQFCENRGMVTF